MKRALIAVVAVCGLMWAVEGAEAQPNPPVADERSIVEAVRRLGEEITASLEAIKRMIDSEERTRQLAVISNLQAQGQRLCATLQANTASYAACLNDLAGKGGVKGSPSAPKRPPYPAWYAGRIMCNAQPKSNVCIQKVCGGLADKALLQLCLTGPTLQQAMTYCQGIAEPGRSQCLQHACYIYTDAAIRQSCLNQYAGKPGTPKPVVDEKAILANVSKIAGQIKTYQDYIARLQAQGQQACAALRANKASYANCLNVLAGRASGKAPTGPVPTLPKKPTN